MNTVNTATKETTDEATETFPPLAYQFVVAWKKEEMQPSLTDNQLLRIVHAIHETEAQCGYLPTPSSKQINLAFKNNMRLCVGASTKKALFPLSPEAEAFIKEKDEKVIQALKNDGDKKGISKDAVLDVTSPFYKTHSQRKKIEEHLLRNSTSLYDILVIRSFQL